MVLDESFFSIAPEAFNTINIDLAGCKELFMIDFKMPVATKHQRVITFEFIGVDDRSAPDSFNCEIQKCSGLDILDDLDLNDPVSLQDAENRDFVGSSTAPFAFASASEIGFVKFDFTPKEVILADRSSGNGHSDDIQGFEHRGVAQGCLLRDFPGTEFQFKELDNPQPLLEADSQAVDPSAGEVVKSIFAAFAAEPSADDLIDFVASASYAETTVVFPT